MDLGAVMCFCLFCCFGSLGMGITCFLCGLDELCCFCCGFPGKDQLVL